jgi:hypothetical protein
MQALGGVALGHMAVVRLDPGAKYSQPANGKEHRFYSPYHIMLHALPGTLVMCGDETVSMLTGEAWWYDPAQEAVVANNSKDDRVELHVEIGLDS